MDQVADDFGGNLMDEIIGLDSGKLLNKTGIKRWENMGITHGTVGIMIFESSTDKTCDYSQ